MIAKSLWHLDQLHSEIRSAHIEDSNDRILLTGLYSLISLGTERLVAQKKVPVKLNKLMKVPYMEGDFLLPVKYGYSWVGKDMMGRVYHLMHPHQDKCLVEKQDITALPELLSPERATLISNLETALNAYWDADPKINDHILIVGFGLIGALVAGLLRLKGHRLIFILEQDEYRKRYAQRLGFQLQPEENYSEPFQVAFHSTGTGQGLQSCIDRMDQEGRIIELSWYGDRSIQIQLGELFHYKRLSIQSSQVSSIPEKLKGQYTFASRKQEVIQLLADPYWDLLLDKVIPFEDAVAWFEQIRSGPIHALSLIIKY